MKLHCVVSCALLAAASLPVFSQTYNQLEELGDSISISANLAGSSAAISADGAVKAVGHPSAGSSGASFRGDVLVYYSGATQPAAELTGAGDVNASTAFGTAVAVSPDGSTILVGDPDAAWPLGSANSGAVYVFQYVNGVWSKTARLTASPQGQYLGHSSRFGQSLAINDGGNTALIGASAPVFVFRRSGSVWAQSDSLPPDSTVAGYGASVSLSADGNTALVGASQFSSGSAPSPAFVFTFSGSSWSQAATLTPSDSTSQGKFGSSNSLSGDGKTAFIGSPGAAAVFVFANSNSGWAQTAKITPRGAVTSNFGTSLATDVDGSGLIVGAAGTPSQVGAVYTYARSSASWSQTGILQPADLPSISPRFGQALAATPDGVEFVATSQLANTYVFGSSDPDFGSPLLFANNTFNGDNTFTGNTTFTGTSTFNGNIALNGGMTASGAVASASGFIGDGSRITNLQPSSLAAGIAYINIAGNAATAGTAAIALSANSATSADSASMAAFASTAGRASSLAVGTDAVPATSFARRDTSNTFQGDQSVTGKQSITGSLRVGGGSPIVEYVSVLTNLSVSPLAAGSCMLLPAIRLSNFTAGANDTVALGFTRGLVQGHNLLYQAWEDGGIRPGITIQVCNPTAAKSTAAVGQIRIDVFKH